MSAIPSYTASPITNTSPAAQAPIDVSPYVNKDAAQLASMLFPNGQPNQTELDKFNQLPPDVKQQIIKRMVEKAMASADKLDNVDALRLTDALVQQWKGPVAAVFTGDMKALIGQMSDLASARREPADNAKAAIDKAAARGSLTPEEMNLILTNLDCVSPELKGELLKRLIEGGPQYAHYVRAIAGSISCVEELDIVRAILGGDGGPEAGRALLERHAPGPMAFQGRGAQRPLWAVVGEIDRRLADTLAGAELNEVANRPAAQGRDSATPRRAMSQQEKDSVYYAAAARRSADGLDIADMIALMSDAVDPEGELELFEAGDPDFMRQISDDEGMLERIKRKISKRDMLRNSLMSLADEENTRRKKLADSFSRIA